MDADAKQKFLINITRYISPHKFFFKLEYDSSELQTKIEELLAIYGTLHRQHGYKGYVPSIDEIVVVYMLPWKKWIRAKCDYVAEFASSEQKFILWALDDGVPFLSTKQWIHPMPEQMTLPTHSIFVGSLNNIIPMERQFNMDELRSENVAARDWTEFAVKVVNDYMNNAAEIWFEPEINCGSYCFGKVIVKTYDGESVDLSSYLVKEGLANSSNSFEKDLTQIVTLAKSRWQKNSGLMDDIIENTQLYVERGPSQSDTSNIRDTNELDVKLDDWSKQNERLRKSTEAECTQHFRQVLDKLANMKLEVGDPFVSTDKSSDKHYHFNMACATNHSQRLQTLRNTEMRQPHQSLGSKSVSNYRSLAKADMVDRDEESDRSDGRSVCSSTSTIFTHKKIFSRALNSLHKLKIDDSDDDECDQVVAPFKARVNVPANKPIVCIPSGHEDDLDAFKKVGANVRNRFVRNRFNNNQGNRRQNNGNKKPANK